MVQLHQKQNIVFTHNIALSLRAPNAKSIKDVVGQFLIFSHIKIHTKSKFLVDNKTILSALGANLVQNSYLTYVSTAISLGQIGLSFVCFPR